MQFVIVFDTFRCRIDRKGNCENLSSYMGHLGRGAGIKAIRLTFLLAYDIFAVKGSLPDSTSCQSVAISDCPVSTRFRRPGK